ncbi:MAG: hypothetical protein ACFFCE_07185 [Promethearchaeota archaeon]
MSKNTGTIIFGIISIIALGLSIYIFISIQPIISTQSRDSGEKLVGIWDNLDENTDYAPYTLTTDWLVELIDNSYNDSSYITVTRTGIRLTLIKAGWYRIQITMQLHDLTTPYKYELELRKNGNFDFIMVSYRTPSSIQTWYQVHASGYVLSDGNDYIEMRVTSDPSDPFYLYQSPDLNQFSIEFVAS